MNDAELKIQMDSIDEQIGDLKNQLIAHERIMQTCFEKIAECRSRMSKLRTQRDDLLTPELFK